MTHAINGKIGGKKIHWIMANIFFFIISNYTQKYMNFFGLFSEKGREGLKHLFLVKNGGGKFFLGGVKKHDFGVGNYP